MTGQRDIADGLRAAIDAGDLAPGAAVPGERELARLHGTARGTARAALLSLTRDGILDPGSPRTVARHDRIIVHLSRAAPWTWAGEAPASGADSWAADVKAAGYEPRQTPPRVETVVARGELAGRLEVPVGYTVTSRSLDRYAGDLLSSLIWFYFPVDVSRGTPLEGPESIVEGSVAWLEEDLGPLAQTIHAYPRTPTLAEEARLGGGPLQVVWRMSRTPARVVMASLALYRSGTTLAWDI